MIYEPFTRRVYLAVPDNNGAGPILLSIDPASGAQGPPIPLPGAPEALALSDGGQVLYMTFNPQSLIARFNIATLCSLLPRVRSHSAWP